MKNVRRWFLRCPLCAARWTCASIPKVPCLYKTTFDTTNISKIFVIFRWFSKIILLERFTIYAVDFEGSLATGILEYGLVGIDSVAGVFSAEGAFCKNKGRISDAEFARHHISEREVAQCTDFINVIPRFVELRKKCFFCAHNAVFENTLLNAYCPVVLNAHSVGSGSQTSWGPWLDTYMLYKKYFKK